jgi:hypothetical protein
MTDVVVAMLDGIRLLGWNQKRRSWHGLHRYVSIDKHINVRGRRRTATLHHDAASGILAFPAQQNKHCSLQRFYPSTFIMKIIKFVGAFLDLMASYAWVSSAPCVPAASAESKVITRPTPACTGCSCNNWQTAVQPLVTTNSTDTVSAVSFSRRARSTATPVARPKARRQPPAGFMTAQDVIEALREKSSPCRRSTSVESSGGKFRVVSPNMTAVHAAVGYGCRRALRTNAYKYGCLGVKKADRCAKSSRIGRSVRLDFQEFQVGTCLECRTGNDWQLCHGVV